MEPPAAEGDAEMQAGPDPELAATMGFSGFGKKARTFDLEAMFEQTRRTAVERSRKVLEAREKEQEDQAGKEFKSSCADPSASVSSATGTGSTLKPRDITCSESEDSSDEELTGPSTVLQASVQSSAGDDDDEEFIGPPLPPGFKDSDDDDTEDEDNERCSSPLIILVALLWTRSKSSMSFLYLEP